MTNKTNPAQEVMTFHHGRGVQEDFIGQAKDEAQMDYIPVKSWNGNLLYCLAAICAHNITKRIQMDLKKQRHNYDCPRRSPLWKFRDLKTTRNTIIRRAGKVTKPQGKLTLTISATEKVESDVSEFLDAA